MPDPSRESEPQPRRRIPRPLLLIALCLPLTSCFVDDSGITPVDTRLVTAEGTSPFETLTNETSSMITDLTSQIVNEVGKGSGPSREITHYPHDTSANVAPSLVMVRHLSRPNSQGYRKVQVQLTAPVDDQWPFDPARVTGLSFIGFGDEPDQQTSISLYRFTQDRVRIVYRNPDEAADHDYENTAYPPGRVQPITDEVVNHAKGLAYGATGAITAG